MTKEMMKTRMAELLLEELRRDGPEGWYYISVANEGTFFGGYFLKAKGPTDAWVRFHALGWYEKDVGAETMTLQCSAEDMVKVPESMRWRKLPKEEVSSI